MRLSAAFGFRDGSGASASSMKRAACSAVDGVGYLLEEHRGAADQERGAAALAPGGQVVADFVLGAAQVDVLDHRGGEVRRGLRSAARRVGKESVSTG